MMKNILVKADFYLALLQLEFSCFFFFLDPFFDFGSVLRAKDGKKPIIFPDTKFCAESFE